MIEAELTIERFRALSEAYGGDIARWPEAARADASFRASEPRYAATLAEAAAMDETLDVWTIAAPSTALTAKIVARAPHPRLAARAKLWWAGAGLAAMLAGAAAGSAAVAAATPISIAFSDNNTAFGVVTSEKGEAF